MATVAEPAPLVLAFVAACLDRGAADVHLFLDVSDRPLQQRLRQVRGCTVTLCDGAYWKTVPGGRPWPVSRRQRINLQRAYDTTSLHWLLHIDADEFLWGQTDLAATLAALPDTVDFAFVETVERVHLRAPDPACIFAGAFRRACPPAMQKAVDAADGDASAFLDRGMTAYAGGKSLFRTGRKLQVEVHVPVGATEARMARLTNHLLLHFDGLTPRRWIDKHRRIIDQQPEWRSFPPHFQYRVNQMAAVHSAGRDQARLDRLYADTKCLDPVREAALRSLGLLVDADPGIAAAVARHVPGPPPDFSAAGYDATITRWRTRRDLQRVKHDLRALRAWFTGRRPAP